MRVFHRQRRQAIANGWRISAGKGYRVNRRKASEPVPLGTPESRPCTHRVRRRCLYAADMGKTLDLLLRQSPGLGQALGMARDY